MSFTGERRGIGKGGVEQTACKMFRVLTEEELRDSKDLGRVKVGAGCQTRTPLVLRVKTPISAGLVAGWNGMLREWVVDVPTELLVLSLLW
jgi:hypothetical protein